MKYLNKIAFKLIAIAFLFAVTNSAFATGGSVTFTSPNSASIPTLSGSMLILLSVLLCVVAYRTAKQKNANINKLFITLLGTGVIFSAGSGIKLVSDANAGGPPPITITFPAGSNSFTDTIPAPPEGGIGVGFFTNPSIPDLSFRITAGTGSVCNFLILPLINPDTPPPVITPSFSASGGPDDSHMGSLPVGFGMEILCGESLTFTE